MHEMRYQLGLRCKLMKLKHENVLDDLFEARSLHQQECFVWKHETCYRAELIFDTENVVQWKRWNEISRRDPLKHAFRFDKECCKWLRWFNFEIASRVVVDLFMDFVTSTDGKIKIERKKTVQSAIRIPLKRISDGEGEKSIRKITRSCCN